MAYLNVRERRVEAKIVYVGAEGAGVTTNLRRLAEDAPGAPGARIQVAGAQDAGAVALSWRPAEGAPFRDCEVHARLVPHRWPRDGAVDAPLADADAAVLVLDRAADAWPRNREALAAVREALARQGRTAVPVVVQVNKADAPGAPSAADALAAAGATGLPNVGACALRGEGVLATLEAALAGLLARLQREGDPSEAAAAARREAADPGAPATSDDGHPLLAALRQVLRDTVRAHVEELEQRLVSRLESSLANAARGHERSEASVAELRKLVVDLGELVMDLSHRTAALTDRAHATLEGVRDVSQDLSALRTITTELRAQRNGWST